MISSPERSGGTGIKERLSLSVIEKAGTKTDTTVSNENIGIDEKADFASSVA